MTIFSFGSFDLQVWPWPSTYLNKCLKLLLLKENNCAKLFWTPCINVEAMAQTSSISDHFIIWPSSVTLTFNLPEQMFETALLLLKENNCAKLFSNIMHKCRSYCPEKLSWWPFHHLIFKSDLDLQHTWKNVSNGTSFPQEKRAKLFWNPCTNVQVMA